MAQTPKAFYEEVSGLLASSLDEFGKMDAMVDEKFGREAPRLSDLKAALEECSQLVARMLKEKRKQEPDVAAGRLPIPRAPACTCKVCLFRIMRILLSRQYCIIS